MNSYFMLYTGTKWQESNCYVLKSSSFYGTSLQQFCCYDTQSGEIITNGKNAGFLYDSLDLESIIQNG